MTEAIDVWWPRLEAELRRWISNNIWSPMHAYARTEIRKAGGPPDDDEFWDRWDDGSRLLPQAAVRWICAHLDRTDLQMPVKDDPRAAYFKRQHWPYR